MPLAERAHKSQPSPRVVNRERSQCCLGLAGTRRCFEPSRALAPLAVSVSRCWQNLRRSLRKVAPIHYTEVILESSLNLTLQRIFFRWRFLLPMTPAAAPFGSLTLFASLMSRDSLLTQTHSSGNGISVLIRRLRSQRVALGRPADTIFIDRKSENDNDLGARIGPRCASCRRVVSPPTGSDSGHWRKT